MNDYGTPSKDSVGQPVAFSYNVPNGRLVAKFFVVCNQRDTAPITVKVQTDADGWYMWSYKWTGKPAEFTITIPSNLGITPVSQKIWLKANGYVEVDWNKP